MLKGITWSHYLTTVLAFVILWYVVVAVIFFRKEIQGIFNGKLRLPVKKEKSEAADSHEKDDAYVDPGAAFDELEAIADDIKISILEVAGKQASKDELLGKLKDRLAFYGGMRQPAFRMAMNNFIIQHAENICGAQFSEQELDEAWVTLPR